MIRRGTVWGRPQRDTDRGLAGGRGGGTVGLGRRLWWAARLYPTTAEALLSLRLTVCPTPSPGRALDSLTTHCRRSIILRLQIPALPFPPRPHPHPLPCLGKKGFLKPEWGAEPRSSLGGVSGPESPRRLDGETGRTGSAACVVPCPLGTRSREEMC